MRLGTLIKETVAAEIRSSLASMILRTGVLPTLVGCNGFETKARNDNPLGLEDFLEELPQETIPTLLAMRTAKAIEVLFKLVPRRA
jgi:hypothetical protein